MERRRASRTATIVAGQSPPPDLLHEGRGRDTTAPMGRVIKMKLRVPNADPKIRRKEVDAVGPDVGPVREPRFHLLSLCPKA